MSDGEDDEDKAFVYSRVRFHKTRMLSAGTHDYWCNQIKGNQITMCISGQFKCESGHFNFEKKEDVKIVCHAFIVKGEL